MGRHTVTFQRYGVRFALADMWNGNFRGKTKTLPSLNNIKEYWGVGVVDHVFLNHFGRGSTRFYSKERTPSPTARGAD